MYVGEGALGYQMLVVLDWSPQLQAGLPRDYEHSALEDIVQLDGACGGSSSEEEEVGEGDAEGMAENEFLGMINAEALRALQEGEGSTAGGSSDSGSYCADELAEEEEEEVRKGWGGVRGWRSRAWWD